MSQRLKINIKPIFKYYLISWGSISTLSTIILAFFTWDELGIDSFVCKILILVGMVMVAFIISIFIVCVKRQNKIIGDINKGIILKYGDIIELSDTKITSKKRIVVIPVNRCFDMTCENNLISPNTIHGKWIKCFLTSKQIQEKLTQKLAELEIRCTPTLLDRSEKQSGNLKRYAPGTVLELELNNTIFYLLALSELDYDLRAHCGEFQFVEALQGLLNHYDKYGQAEDVFCPIMCDHIVRPRKDTKDVIGFMLSYFKLNSNLINGKLHLIVYEEMKSDISILEYK